MHSPRTSLLAFILAFGQACSDDTQPGGDDTSDGTTPFQCTLDTDGGGGECPECIEEKCSDLIPYCEEDAACACMVECLRQEGVGGVEDCLEGLGLSDRPIGFAQVEECVAFACPDSDECSTPEDWTPPDADLECDGAGSGGLGGGSESDCAFDSTEVDPEGDILQLQSIDGDVCVRLERSSDGAGSLQNTSWTLLNIRIGPVGEVAHVSTESDLCWYSSHHNFRDWAHIWTGTRHYDLALKEDGHGGSRRYHLYAFEEGPLDADECAPTADGDRCIDGPILLYPYEP